jgi:deoxyribose-phosphate aldolase
MTLHDTDRLIEQITREVMASLNIGGTPCAGGEGSCSSCGRCAQRAGAAVQRILEAGASRVGGGLGMSPPGADIARYIDHTILKPEATRAQIVQLCAEARQFGFAAVCVNPFWVRTCAEQLAGSAVKVCSVVGFPLGATMPEAKVYETRRAIQNGADEIDMVINIGALKGGEDALVEADIAGVVLACQDGGAHSKVIIEAVLLTDEEKVRACTLAKAAGADFVKTSTGFSTGGATAADVALMRRVVGPELGVKAAGGIRSYADAEKMVAAGATRIGASASVKILQEAKGGAR